MPVIVQDLLTTLAVSLITLLIGAAWYVRYSYGYWKRRNVPYLEPKFPFGNSNSLFPKGISIGAITRDFYNKFKSMGHTVGGIYFGIEPKLVILNPDHIRDIMIKDFQNFTDRGIYHTESDPLSVHMFSQAGNEWRNARVKLTSVFTSAKMKSMFQTMLDCSEGLEEALKGFAEQKNDVDILEVMACFTTDVIGSCAFGIQCNSFKHPDAEFRTMGRKLFSEFNFMDRLNLFASIYAPKLSQKLGVRSIQKDISRFFLHTISENVQHREKNNLRRNDLFQLLIDLKNSGVQFSMNELIGQVFLFFAAGFETSSATASLTLFEVSRNEEAQKKIRKEILEVLERHDNKVTYDAIAEMKYLGQAVDETLRLWPPVTNLSRVCTKDYKLQGTDITVEKDTTVLISALGLHHDSEYWPDPEKWDPDRFSEANKDNRRPFTYLPFGEGPRNCIGLRFGLLQTKIALVTVLRNYRVSMSPKTILPLGIHPETFVLSNINRAYLLLDRI